MILTGELAPGEIVVEPRLAERFNISKTPVREALRILEAQGLVSVLPKKGYLVQTMTPQDLSEVLDLRMLLEPHAAAEASRFAGSQEVAQMRAAVEAQRETAETDQLASMRSARDFHLAVVHAARNTRLLGTLTHCYDETARAHHIITELRDHMAHPLEVEEHEAIIAQIESGRPAEAAEAMRAHLRTIHRATSQRLAGGSGLWSD